MTPNTGSTLVAIFDDRLEAERAVRDLETSGIEAGKIGFAMRGGDVGAGGMITDTSGTKDARGALAGAVTGGLAGGALAATVTALLMPGVGPVVAAGAAGNVSGIRRGRSGGWRNSGGDDRAGGFGRGSALLRKAFQ